MRHRPFALTLTLAFAAATSCGETTEPTPCDAYRAALIRYADRCAPFALPGGRDPATIECKSDEELAQDAGEHELDLASCTALLERHADPCVGLLSTFDPSSSEPQRDEHAELRCELYACTREPIADIAPLPFGDDCAAWRHAVERYRVCDPAIIPAVTRATRCADDAELPEGRTVRGCAETLWERSDAPCYVPLGDERVQCLEEVIAN